MNPVANKISDEAGSHVVEAARPVSGKRHGWQIYRRGPKRLLDIAAILLATPILLPVIVALAILASRDGGPPFYAQMRVGKGGRPFKMWKFRTMVPGADGLLEKYLAENPEARREWDETQKLKSDPRITAWGALLRRSSLDELPQLWNVLVGDMSLVGPRPMMLSQQVLYPSGAYYKLRPGITGYWQTAGRNRTAFEARAEFDAAYEADLSLLTDVKVLVATVGTVLACTGF